MASDILCITFCMMLLDVCIVKNGNLGTLFCLVIQVIILLSKMLQCIPFLLHAKFKLCLGLREWKNACILKQIEKKKNYKKKEKLDVICCHK